MKRSGLDSQFDKHWQKVYYRAVDELTIFCRKELKKFNRKRYKKLFKLLQKGY